MDHQNMTNETVDSLLALQISAGVASGLSIFGALCVIFVYLLDSTRRKLHPFLILTFASFAEIIVAVSHIWGLAKLEQYVRGVDAQGEVGNFYVSVECGAQAVLAVYGTIASFLWTSLFALYVFAVHAGDCVDIAFRTFNCQHCWEGDTTSKIQSCFKSQPCLAIFHFVGWGIPICLIVLLGATGSFGFDRNIDFGWCYVRADGFNIVALILGYELWAFLFIFLLFVFAFGTLVAIRAMKQTEDGQPEQQQLPEQSERQQQQEQPEPPVQPEHATSVNIFPQQTEEPEQPDESSQESYVLGYQMIIASFIFLGLRITTTVIDLIALVSPDYKIPWFAIVIAGICGSLQGFITAACFIYLGFVCAVYVQLKSLCTCRRQRREEYQILES